VNVKTNWHLDGLDLDDGGDPMGEILELKSGAAVIDLTRDVAILQADLLGSLSMEAFLYREYDGLHCDMKMAATHRVHGGSGLSCYGCSQYTKDPEDLGSLICREGRRQEDIVGQLSALGEFHRLDDELVAAYERDMASCDELVAMCGAAA
jgi:hypothetical protein